LPYYTQLKHTHTHTQTCFLFFTNGRQQYDSKDCLSQGVLLPVLTWGAILNSRSAAPLATGGRLSRTAPFVNMNLMALVHSAPLSAAVTGKICTNKDIPERK